MKDARALTPQQERFCAEYVKNGGRSFDAYKVAYPKSAAGKRTVLELKASRLLAQGKIQARIAELQQIARQVAEERFDLQVENVLRGLQDIATADVLDAWRDDMHLKPINEWPKALRMAVAGMEISEEHDADGNVTGYLRKVKFITKTAALDMLMKHFGGYAADNKQRFGDLAALSRDKLNELEGLIAQLLDDQSKPVLDTTAGGAAPVTH